MGGVAPKGVEEVWSHVVRVSFFSPDFCAVVLQALYREEHSPMDADEDRVGNRGGVELYVAPLYRTMESSDPGPSV